MSTKDRVKRELLELTNDTNFLDEIEVIKYAEIIKEKMQNITAFSQIIKNDNKLFTRARKNKSCSEMFMNKDDLWYNKNFKEVETQRANYIGKPVFYCSNAPATSIMEIKPEINDYITTIEVQIKKDELNLFCIGFNTEKTKLFKQISASDQGFHEFSRTIFSEEIQRKESHNYLKSAVIAQAYLSNCDGIIYPSVATKCKGWNLAFSPEFIDKYSEITKANVHKIIEKNSNLDMNIECILKSNSLDKEKNFNWEKVLNCTTHKINESIYS